MVVFFNNKCCVGCDMKIGQELEMIRELRNLSVIDICNAMGITESEYRHMVYRNRRPTIYQLIMFIIATQHHLEFVK